MPVGICKLCLTERDLRDSHYIPASLYRRIRKMAGADPIIMTPKLVMSSSRQIHDYVLCADCEHRLNVGGEKYIGDISADGSHFPLRDMLSNGTPSPLGPFLCYSGKQIGVDVQKVAYFAVSMVWRGAVHTWKTVDRQTSQLTLPSHLEDMRRFLMDEIALPAEIGLLVIVCLDFASQVHVLAPFLVGDETLLHSTHLDCLRSRCSAAFPWQGCRSVFRSPALHSRNPRYWRWRMPKSAKQHGTRGVPS